MLEKNQINFDKISLIHNQSLKSLKIVEKLGTLYDFIPPGKSDIIVVVGGTSELLHTIIGYMTLGIPFYGINSGSIGFL